MMDKLQIIGTGNGRVIVLIDGRKYLATEVIVGKDSEGYHASIDGFRYTDKPFDGFRFLDAVVDSIDMVGYDAGFRITA